MASKHLPRESKKRKSPWIRIVKQASVLLATVVFLGMSVLGFFYFNAHRDAEDAMNDLQNRIDAVNKPTTKMMSKDGVVLFSVSSENRIPLKLDQIPKFVQNAVIAAEDRRFYQHTGVDLTSIARVIFVDMRGHKLSQGGSTITMQLVKLLFNGSSKTFRRKMNDIAYAQVMEQKLPKERILELYLNKVFFGEGAYGIGEAAKVYFNKNINDLTIGEAAMLARCIRRPSFENPIKDLEAATNNRDVVLGTMREEHMITDEQYDKAVAEKPKISSRAPNAGVQVAPGAEYFVDHVKQFLERDKDLGLDLINGGYTIQTTLDYSLQRQANAVVKEIVDENRRRLVTQGAFMVMDSDGNILAEVGGLNYRNHQQNIITQGSLQPGSGFKPILYATALKAGIINMDSMLSNAPIREVDPITGKIWTPGNSSKSENKPFYGLRTALASSINLPAIHTIKEVGPEAVVQTAIDSFGFRSKLEPYEPLALGSSAVAPVEMAEAYSVFMLRGDRVRPQPVFRILDSEGNLVKQYEPQKFPGVFDPAVCDEMDELLKGVVLYGTGREARIVPDARGKTGTTNDAKDAWFTGYTDGLLGVGWVGHEVKIRGIWTPIPMSEAVYGGTVTAKIWAQIMKVARDRYGKAPVQVQQLPAQKPKTDGPAAPGVDPDLNAPPSEVKTDTAATTGDPTVAATDPVNSDPAKVGDVNAVPAKLDPAKVDATNLDHTKLPKDKPTDPDPSATSASKPDAPPAKPKRPARTSDEAKSDTVKVEICVDTNLVANSYCPEVVTRTFKRGKEPKRKCHIHGPGG